MSEALTKTEGYVLRVPETKLFGRCSLEKMVTDADFLEFVREFVRVRNEKTPLTPASKDFPLYQNLTVDAVISNIDKYERELFDFLDVVPKDLSPIGMHLVKRLGNHMHAKLAAIHFFNVKSDEMKKEQIDLTTLQ